MHELRRTVRLSLALPGAPAPADPAPEGTAAGWTNSYAAVPGAEGLALHLEVEVAVRGEPDPATGYLVDIGVIDRAVRSCLVPLADVVAQGRAVPAPGALLRELCRTLPGATARPVHEVRLRLAPRYSLAMDPQRPDRTLLRQSFEFAASHRLHIAGVDDSRNREIFGKCSNPNGHGHNYRLEVAVACALGRDGWHRPSLATIEAIVRRQVLDRFDHRHLNLDTEEFAGLIPSVENIARVCHRLLADAIDDAGGELVAVTVWETEKTACTYPV